MSANPYEASSSTVPSSSQTDRSKKMRNISGLIFILSLITTRVFVFYAENYISQFPKSFDGVLILTDQTQRNIYIIGAIISILALIVIISAILTLIKTIQIGFRKKDPTA